MPSDTASSRVSTTVLATLSRTSSVTVPGNEGVGSTDTHVLSSGIHCSLASLSFSPPREFFLNGLLMVVVGACASPNGHHQNEEQQQQESKTEPETKSSPLGSPPASPALDRRSPVSSPSQRPRYAIKKNGQVYKTRSSRPIRFNCLHCDKGLVITYINTIKPRRALKRSASSHASSSPSTSTSPSSGVSSQPPSPPAYHGGVDESDDLVEGVKKLQYEEEVASPKSPKVAIPLPPPSPSKEEVGELMNQEAPLPSSQDLAFRSPFGTTVYPEEQEEQVSIRSNPKLENGKRLSSMDTLLLRSPFTSLETGGSMTQGDPLSQPEDREIMPPPSSFPLTAFETLFPELQVPPLTRVEEEQNEVRPEGSPPLRKMKKLIHRSTSMQVHSPDGGKRAPEVMMEEEEVEQLDVPPPFTADKHQQVPSPQVRRDEEEEEEEEEEDVTSRSPPLTKDEKDMSNVLVKRMVDTADVYVDILEDEEEEVPQVESEAEAEAEPERTKPTKPPELEPPEEEEEETVALESGPASARQDPPSTSARTRPRASRPSVLQGLTLPKPIHVVGGKYNPPSNTSTTCPKHGQQLDKNCFHCQARQHQRTVRSQRKKSHQPTHLSYPASLGLSLSSSSSSSSSPARSASATSPSTCSSPSTSSMVSCSPARTLSEEEEEEEEEDKVVSSPRARHAATHEKGDSTQDHPWPCIACDPTPSQRGSLMHDLRQGFKAHPSATGQHEVPSST